MSDVLVDTSIWIDFFRGNQVANPLFDLIENNQIITNDLILAELIPSINRRKEEKLRDILLSVQKIELSINWHEIISMQTMNLRSGNNNIGIPDLIIAQNALHNELVLFENDKHFQPMKELFGLELLRHKRDLGTVNL